MQELAILFTVVVVATALFGLIATRLTPSGQDRDRLNRAG